MAFITNGGSTEVEHFTCNIKFKGSNWYCEIENYKNVSITFNNLP